MAEAESDEVVAATFKILVLGDSNVGKSSLIKSCSTNQRPKNLMPTVGMLLLASWSLGRWILLPSAFQGWISLMWWCQFVVPK